MIRRRTLLAGGVAAPLPALAQPALAQAAWPTRPITFVVAYPAGGANDLVARTVAERMRTVLGQPIIIENRGGAAGTLGAAAAARAAPDGYTLFMAAGAHTIAPALQPNLPYDIVGDFRPISRVAASSFILVTRNDLGLADVQALIARAKAEPGRLNFASSGAGAPPHLAAALMMEMAGIRMEHVPYAGDTPGLADLVAGHVDLGFMSFAATKPLVDAGRLRALAVTDAARNPLMPALPTVAESGLPGYEVTTWWGLLAPRGAPDMVVERVHAAVMHALGESAVTQRFAELGLVPVGSTPDAFAERIRADLDRFGQIVRGAGLSP